MPEELRVEVSDIVQEAVIRTIPRKNKCKKAKWSSEEALQIAVKRREVKGKGERERYTHLNVEFQRMAGRDKKAFLSKQCKDIERENRETASKKKKKIRDTKRASHTKMGTTKERNGKDLTEEEINNGWQDYTVQFCRSVESDSLRPHESQHARPPCLSPTPRVHSDSCPSSQ